MIVCIIESCDKESITRGWCKRHYQRWRKHGDPLVSLFADYGHIPPERAVWDGIKTRCYNPNSQDYKNYGGRGIKVCEAWRSSFKIFYSDMGPRPQGRYSIERINNNGDYEPNNCKWATPREQTLNRRNKINATYHGRAQTVKQWARELGIPAPTIYWWYQRGFCLEDKVQQYGLNPSVLQAAASGEGV